MASLQMPFALATARHDYQVEEPNDHNSDSDDSENIPYHARQSARPFTYGNLPEGYKQSDLNHVTFSDIPPETPKTFHTFGKSTSPAPQPQPQALPQPYSSPGLARKSTRPSISPSRPVLRKTPSRQEFEEMLMERREQSMREQNNFATKLAQNAAIQKDLDELQGKLTKSVVLQGDKVKLPSNAPKTIVKHVESIDLPDAATAIALIEENILEETRTKNTNADEPALIIAEPKRSETPSFPIESKSDERCMSPYPMVAPSTPTPQHKSNITSGSDNGSPIQPNTSAKSVHYKSQITSAEHQEVEPHLVKFAKDSSDFWYKPHFTRDEAVSLLRNAAPGTFIIRNSTTYKNAYGLVLRVAKPPPGVPISDQPNGLELVRHYLLEPTARGVRLKGCANEPVFTSLSAFVYQHSINQLALPCKLIIPDCDLLYTTEDAELVTAQKQLMSQGAACNVLYLFTCGMESLTGNEAMRKAVNELNSLQQQPQPTEVHFKVTQEGITLTDNTRKIFFRRHYASKNISHIGLDPNNRFFRVIANDDGNERQVNKTIFGFVARPTTGAKDNQCHLFCDLAANQPASAIIAFANKVLPSENTDHLI